VGSTRTPFANSCVVRDFLIYLKNVKRYPGIVVEFLRLMVISDN